MSNLKNFIENQRARAATRATVDWVKRRDKWLSELDQLFEWIRSQLASAGLDPQAMTRSHIDLNEERLGPYQAPVLSIQLPTRIFVDFRPKASVIVGGYGRVDVKSRHSLTQIMLIAIDADDNRDPDDPVPPYEREWKWKVFPSRGMRGSYLLDSDGLGQLLEEAAVA